jgi:uncharacterized membrane protein YoaK (UPF0700 family)
MAALAATERATTGTVLTARRREQLIVLLAVVSGVTDAAGFVGLGGAFSSVMTGNMVLLGLSGGTGNGSLAARTGAAILAFIIGCGVGGRLAGRAKEGQPVWPASVTIALAAELAVLCVYTLGLEAVGGHPGDVTKSALLACNAMALGIQSSAIQRFGVSGLSTTYLTGTLTTTIVHLASGRPARHVALNLKLLAGLIVGAAAGGLLATHAMRLTPLLQLAGLGTVIACAWLAGQRDGAGRATRPAGKEAAGQRAGGLGDMN